MPPIDEWLSFIHTAYFDEGWSNLGLTDEDLVRLQSEILQNPESGSVVSGTGGLRKLRFAADGGGKSGGCRVCYANFEEFGIVVLVLVYGKRAKADISPADKKAIAQVLGAFESELRKRNEE